MSHLSLNEWSDQLRVALDNKNVSEVATLVDVAQSRLQAWDKDRFVYSVLCMTLCWAFRCEHREILDVFEAAPPEEPSWAEKFLWDHRTPVWFSQCILKKDPDAPNIGMYHDLFEQTQWFLRHASTDFTPKGQHILCETWLLNWMASSAPNGCIKFMNEHPKLPPIRAGLEWVGLVEFSRAMDGHRLKEKWEDDIRPLEWLNVMLALGSRIQKNQRNNISHLVSPWTGELSEELVDVMNNKPATFKESVLKLAWDLPEWKINLLKPIAHDLSAEIERHLLSQSITPPALVSKTKKM